jgi:transcriptional regulator with XRE-family HTH domain
MALVRTNFGGCSTVGRRGAAHMNRIGRARVVWPSSARQCRSLAQYRRCVLRRSQREIAKNGGLWQAQISALERGEVPEPRQWSRYLSAYRLSEREFLRLARVKSARRHKRQDVVAAVTQGAWTEDYRPWERMIDAEFETV